MQTFLGAILGLGLSFAPAAAQATETKVVLDVHHAGCVLCGPIVKSTLEHVNGVSSVTVSQPDGMADVTAVVTYDDGQTSPEALIQATTGRGYPADISKKTSG
ncbi:mercury transporter [Mesorhizobium sp. B4-1-1]|uniref:mercury transporter n=1 Tax=Mesorhizobium sp. B4-1-1 TaxID=2589890 RepID=UPI00112C5F53|nr:mercury transporter [Mesorhizobium sp. B4-1-1]TPI19360.1 mercury transporter [Mesorhizobium sp. B4-1-1]